MNSLGFVLWSLIPLVPFPGLYSRFQGYQQQLVLMSPSSTIISDEIQRFWQFWGITLNRTLKKSFLKLLVGFGKYKENKYLIAVLKPLLVFQVWRLEINLRGWQLWEVDYDVSRHKIEENPSTQKLSEWDLPNANAMCWELQKDHTSEYVFTQLHHWNDATQVSF